MDATTLLGRKEFVLSMVLNEAKVKTCSHDGCNNNAKKGGVCIKHGAKVKTCSHEGCNSYAIEGGVCVKHGAKKTPKTCSNEGCTNQVQKNGVCYRHRMGNPCTYTGCKYRAKEGSDRCGRHTRKSSIDTEETTPDPIPSICLPCNDDHKYDEETDDEIEYETSDQPIKIKTEPIKEEDDNAYNQDTDDEDSVEKVPV